MAPGRVCRSGSLVAAQVRLDPSTAVAAYNVVVCSKEATVTAAAIVAVAVAVAVKAACYISVA